MLRKKLTSLILAMSMTATAVVSVSAYAKPIHETWGDDFNPEEFADCIKLDDYDWLISKGAGYPYTYNVAMYMYQEYPGDYIVLYNVYWYPDEIDITLLDESLVDEITAKAESIDENLTLCFQSTRFKDAVPMTHLTFRSNDSDGTCMPISTEEASAFFELIKDDVEEYNFTSNIYLYQTGYLNYLTYKLEYLEREGVEIQDIQDFIDSEKIDAEIRINGEDVSLVPTMSVVPNSDISLKGQKELSKKLDKEFGISNSGYGGWLDSPGDGLGMGGTVDMKNAVKGDANDDSEISIADATAILQSLGNPDKYRLSVQGKYNADVYGNRDGITPMDAITIQQYNAKLIDSF